MVTLKSLAEHVGVSVSTVSNAYNRPDQLSSALRERILAAAEALGYSGPDAAARALRRGKTNTVGVLFTEQLSYAFSDPYAVEMLSGLTAACEKRGVGVLLIPVAGPDGGAPALESAAVDAITAFCLRPDHSAVQIAASRGIPFVGETILEEDGQSWVSIDESLAGRRIGEHIRKLGHRNVAIVAASYSTFNESGFSLDGPDRPQVTLTAAGHVRNADDQQRLTAMSAELPDAHVEVVATSANSRAAGTLAASLLLDRQLRPTAILCLSDVLAVGVIDALKVRGLIPGRDISVTGFDDLPIAEDANLTTIHQPAHEKGRLIGELMLNPDSPERQVILETELVVRSSTGPAPTV